MQSEYRKHILSVLVSFGSGRVAVASARPAPAKSDRLRPQRCHPGPGAPWLSVWHTDTPTVVVAWPLSGIAGFFHATANLVTGGGTWTEIAPPFQTNGANLHFIEPPPAGNKFYRLHHP